MSLPIENLEQKRAVFKRDFKTTPSINTLVMMDTARVEAVSLKHNYVGTEHLLLAASSNPDTAEALDRMSLNPSAIKEAIVFIMGQGREPVEADRIGMSPKARSGILVGAEEARSLSQSTLEPSHILVGLASMEGKGIGGGGIAMGIVESKGYRPEQFSSRILQARQERISGATGEQTGFSLDSALSDLQELNDLLTRPGINVNMKSQIAALLRTVNTTYNPKFRL